MAKGHTRTGLSWSLLAELRIFHRDTRGINKVYYLSPTSSVLLAELIKEVLRRVKPIHYSPQTGCSWALKRSVQMLVIKLRKCQACRLLDQNKQARRKVDNRSVGNTKSWIVCVSWKHAAALCVWPSPLSSLVWVETSAAWGKATTGGGNPRNVTHPVDTLRRHCVHFVCVWAGWGWGSAVTGGRISVGGATGSLVDLGARQPVCSSGGIAECSLFL